MKILLCHNYYQLPGGEDRVFEDESRMLEENGHEVYRFTRHNDAIRDMSRWEVARRTLWNRDTYRKLRALIRRERPHLMHCTNTFPLISPAAYYAARAEGVPVIQSLHNYRLLCSNVLFLRDGRTCEDCLGKAVPWSSVLHGCYRNSRAASGVVTAMLGIHRMIRTWTRAVNVYVALTEFSRAKFIEGGLPSEKIVVKPNFVHPDPGPGEGRGGYAVFVGRLSPEKGISTLFQAWQCLGGQVPLKIVGDGPLAGQVRDAAGKDPAIEWLGQQPPSAVNSIIGDATCLVLPSLTYENCPKTLLEAYAKGTPLVASRMGATAELVRDGCTGLLFDPGNPIDLAENIRKLISADPSHRNTMRRSARHEFTSKYTADANCRKLMSIYDRTLSTASSSRTILHGI